MHHSSVLERPDHTTREELPTTAIPRTLLDLAAVLPRRGLEEALERAERLGLLDVGAVDSLLGRAGRHAGIGSLRSVLDLHRQPALTRSGLERRFRRLIRDSTLPMPAMNFHVSGFELDAYWEVERFAVELDGYDFHRGRKAFERDRARQEELKLAGVEMIRLTARRIAEDPDGVIDRLGVFLERRRRELAAAGASKPGGGLARDGTEPLGQ